MQTGFTEHQPAVHGWKKMRCLYLGPNLKSDALWISTPARGAVWVSYGRTHPFQTPTKQHQHRGLYLACLCMVCLQCYPHLSGLISSVQCCCTLPKTNKSSSCPLHQRTSAFRSSQESCRLLSTPVQISQMVPGTLLWPHGHLICMFYAPTLKIF